MARCLPFMHNYLETERIGRVVTLVCSKCGDTITRIREEKDK